MMATATKLNNEAAMLLTEINNLGHTREVWSAYDCIVTASNSLASASAWLNAHNERHNRNDRT